MRIDLLSKESLFVLKLRISGLETWFTLLNENNIF